MWHSGVTEKREQVRLSRLEEPCHCLQECFFLLPELIIRHLITSRSPAQLVGKGGYLVNRAKWGHLSSLGVLLFHQTDIV